MGSEQLYNVDDAANDNNFKAIYASPSDDGDLTDGVETITFDTAGYAVVNGDAETKFTAVEGTRTLETRRTGTYATVVRNDNMVFVTDSTFISVRAIRRRQRGDHREPDSFELDGEALDPRGGRPQVLDSRLVTVLHSGRNTAGADPTLSRRSVVVSFGRRSDGGATVADSGVVSLYRRRSPTLATLSPALWFPPRLMRGSHCRS